MNEYIKTILFRRAMKNKWNGWTKKVIRRAFKREYIFSVYWSIDKRDHYQLNRHQFKAMATENKCQ